MPSSHIGNRPNTALLVVEVWNSGVDGAHGRDAVVANVGTLVEKARRNRVPVVWVQQFRCAPLRGERRLADCPRTASGRAERLRDQIQKLRQETVGVPDQRPG
jgi:nicotinamidase-related amidase